MKLAGIASVLVMLVLTLAACGGSDETALERQVRTYLEANQGYHLHGTLGAPDDARLDAVRCGKPGRFAVIACGISVGGMGDERFIVQRTAGQGFTFHRCPGGVNGGDGIDPCEERISH
jgi:hypothetical protein